MNVDVSTFIQANMSPVQTAHITSILESLEEVYSDYDDTLLLDQVDLSNSGAYEADETANIIYSIIFSEARTVLAVHGILVNDNASASTVDALLQVLINVARVEDTEDVLCVLDVEDSSTAICILVPMLASAEDGCGFNPTAILTDIDRIDPVLIDRIRTKLLTGEPAETPLTPPQLVFTTKFPDNIVSEMLSPPSILYTGGDLRMYTSVFSDMLTDETPPDILTTCVGMIVVSSLQVSEYKDALFDLLATYLEPEEHVSIARQASEILTSLENT